MSCAIAIRPNLLPVAAALGGGFAAVAAGLSSGRAPWKRLWRFVAGSLPGPLVIAALNAYLYKSPLTSGYGSLNELYAVANVWPNVARYWSWLVEVETPLILLAPLAFLVLLGVERGAAPRDSWSPRLIAIVGMSMATILVVAYLFYFQFNDFSYLRFLLPAFPVLLVLGAWLVWFAAERLAPRARPWVATSISILLVAAAVRADARLDILERCRGLERYRTAGEHIAKHLPQNAVVFSMEHSGSVRYYGNRVTVRYDMIAPHELDAAIDGLRRSGFRPYLLLEAWEEPKFRQQFSGRSRFANLDWPPLEDFSREQIRLYELLDRP